MAFKGTRNRSRRDIEEQIEYLGGHFNAYTTREYTTYFTQGFKQDVPYLVGLLSDVLQNSLLETSHVQAERSVILTEKEDVEKSVEEVLYDYLHTVAYSGTSLSLTILGQRDHIMQIQRQDLINYISTYYTGPRMVLVGAGAVDHEELVELADKHFSGLSPHLSPDPYSHLESIPFSPGMILNPELHAGRNKVHLGICFESVGWSHPDYFVFVIIQRILGNWNEMMPTDKLSHFGQVVVNSELATSFQMFYTCYKKTGIFGVHAVTTPTAAPVFIKEFVKSFARITETVTEEEFDKLKTQVKVSTLMNLDGSHSIAEDIGKQVLSLGRRITPAEMYLRVDAITKEDLVECLHVYFNDVCPVVAGIGDVGTIPDYAQIRDWTNWERE
eukprot:TRINITY_DN3072_c0_g1_i19.p1 TRINITY_DN3072_c0_g1~~TRINITY_DN3072_c0_g1_i19.p1  ORF type:complete len:386 (+),score=78.36 TRINITY_DN3072_c0_g1_i19:339-1496(+)